MSAINNKQESADSEKTFFLFISTTGLRPSPSASLDDAEQLWRPGNFQMFPIDANICKQFILKPKGCRYNYTYVTFWWVRGCNSTVADGGIWFLLPSAEVELFQAKLTNKYDLLGSLNLGPTTKQSFLFRQVGKKSLLMQLVISIYCVQFWFAGMQKGFSVWF